MIKRSVMGWRYSPNVVISIEINIYVRIGIVYVVIN